MSGRMVTLRNDFHGTSVRVVLPESGKLSARVSARVNRELCGMDCCECGTIRGPQDEGSDMAWDSYVDESRYDGTLRERWFLRRRDWGAR